MVLVFRQYSIEGMISMDWVRLAGLRRSRKPVLEPRLRAFRPPRREAPSHPPAPHRAAGAARDGPGSWPSALGLLAPGAALAAPGAHPRAPRVRAPLLPRDGGHHRAGRAGAEARDPGLGLPRPGAARDLV